MELKDLQKKYEELGKEIEALKEEDLSVDLSEFPKFMSFPNGQGKSNFVICVNDTEGESRYKSFWLDYEYDWEISKSDSGKAVT